MDDLLEKLRLARQRNIAIYKRLADALPEAKELGWRVRQPDEPDVTMEIVRHSLRRSVAETKEALREIVENDEEIMRLSKLLAEP